MLGTASSHWRNRRLSLSGCVISRVVRTFCAWLRWASPSKAPTTSQCSCWLRPRCRQARRWCELMRNDLSLKIADSRIPISWRETGALRVDRGRTATHRRATDAVEVASFDSKFAPVGRSSIGRLREIWRITLRNIPHRSECEEWPAPSVVPCNARAGEEARICISNVISFAQKVRLRLLDEQRPPYPPGRLRRRSLRLHSVSESEFRKFGRHSAPARPDSQGSHAVLSRCKTSGIICAI